MSDRLQVAVGTDPGWALDVPRDGCDVATPDGTRRLGRVEPGAEFWLETLPAPGADALLRLVGLFVRADRESSQLSIELATRYEELDLLYTISEVLGQTVQLTEAAETIVRAVSDVVGAARASIAVLDEEARVLHTVAAQGFDAARAADIPLDDPASIAARVVREARPLVGTAPHGSGAADGRGYRSGAYMSVPISYQPPGGVSRCIGVINLTDRAQGGRFSATDVKLVSAAANQIGAAIELARLVAKEREQQRLHDELELAHDLQLSLLPDPSVLQGDAVVAVRCLPAEQVGGDFYTFNRLGLGLVGIMIGDVASHGFAAALVMAAVMAAIGIHASAATTPDITLAELRDSLAAKLASSDSYLTVFYGILDPVTRRVVWASAGHPYAFRIPASGVPERLDATAPPLGLAGRAAIGMRSLPWERGIDLLCLWTDGLVDAANEAGERYGEARLLAALAARRGFEPERIVAEVLADADAFAPHPMDDRTLLVLRI
ncbi:MAG TPA: SpoIIE family protein phosphatase [Gemmatimonadales bacterium]|nr:SpoIIE family protein phosphatase [Gemmatimonadales bacterium]